METSSFASLVGKEVYAVVPLVDPKLIQRLLVCGVESGGIWVECQALTDLILTKIGRGSTPKTPIFFLAYHEMRFVYYAENVPAMNLSAPSA
jgi:hypothetical protein